MLGNDEAAMSGCEQIRCRPAVDGSRVESDEASRRGATDRQVSVRPLSAAEQAPATRTVYYRREAMSIPPWWDIPTSTEVTGRSAAAIA